MIKAIIFDFDGLILETESAVYRSWIELFQKHACELPFSTWSQMVGVNPGRIDPFDVLEQKIGRAVAREQLAPRRAQRELDLIYEEKPLPGVVDYLQTARRLGLKIGLASSSGRPWVAGHLERIGLLPYFDCIRTENEVRRTKPDPELYLANLEMLGVQADEAIALEDSPPGVAAATAAGIYCVAVPNALTIQMDLSKARLVLGSLAELPLEALIRRVEGE